MTVEVASGLGEALSIVPGWSALADAVGARHYAQPFWCLPWWRHRGSGELHVAYVEDQEQPVALAPLYRRRVMGVDVLRFLGSEFSQVSEVLVAEGHEDAGRELWESLLALPRSVLDLTGFRHRSLGLSVGQGLERPGWTARLESSCPTVALTGPWEDYLQSRGKPLLRKLRRADQFLERDRLEAKVVVARDHREVAAVRQDVAAVFDAAEREWPRLHFFSEPYVGFMSEVLDRAAEESRLALYLLCLGGRPAATAVMFRSGTMLGYSGPRYDPAFRSYSPGHLVLRAVIEDACRQGLQEVDLLRGDAAYKREWATSSYETVAVTGSTSRRLQLLWMMADVASTSPRLRRAGLRLRTLRGRTSSSAGPERAGPDSSTGAALNR